METIDPSAVGEFVPNTNSDSYYTKKILGFTAIQIGGATVAFVVYWAGISLNDPYTIPLSPQLAIKCFLFLIIASFLGWIWIYFVALRKSITRKFESAITSIYHWIETFGIDSDFLSEAKASTPANIPRENFNLMVFNCAIANLIAASFCISLTGGSQNSILSPFLFATISILVIIDETTCRKMVCFAAITAAIYYLDNTIFTQSVTEGAANEHQRLMAISSLICFVFSIFFAAWQRHKKHTKDALRRREIPALTSDIKAKSDSTLLPGELGI